MTGASLSGLRVHLVGAGMIGSSVGLAARASGATVTLQDASPTAAALAADVGVGAVMQPPAPDVVVVATPPDVTAASVVAALTQWPQATVTDVASIKGAVVAELCRQLPQERHRFVPGHPLAGRERSGTIAARADLFAGRAWVITPLPELAGDPDYQGRVEAISQLAHASGAQVAITSPGEHDEAVAALSHLPQVVASLVAARLADFPAATLTLAGQGLRDVTRIAASDPSLWTQILAGNAPALSHQLAALHTDLSEILAAVRTLEDPNAAAARAVLARQLERGNLGQSRIPGKHGAQPTSYSTVTALVPDQPGALARLLTEIGECGINLEDLHLEHGLGQPLGAAELAVLPQAAEGLRTELLARGWQLLD